MVYSYKGASIYFCENRQAVVSSMIWESQESYGVNIRYDLFNAPKIYSLITYLLESYTYVLN